MFQSYAKKLVVIGNIFMSMTNSKEDLDKVFFAWDLKIVNYIIVLLMMVEIPPPLVAAFFL